MTDSHRVLNHGHLAVVVPTDCTGRHVNGQLFEPPRLYAVWYDLEQDRGRSEPISFGAARALAPEKLELALAELRKAREAAAARRAA